MALEQDPNDINRINRDEELRRQQRLDNELQADPELAEGPAGGGRIAVFAIAILAVLGVVFYGLNNSSTSPTSTAQNPPAAGSTVTQNSPGAMTPKPNAANPNTAPGQTTGAAPKPDAAPQPSVTPQPNTPPTTPGTSQPSGSSDR
ncbi:MAG: hypothetical protein BGO65_01345 [Afipia sp. 64-13]|nr:MAG: hypothetical protein BGO65_01345 [Afipia sp. 64-13]